MVSVMAGAAGAAPRPDCGPPAFCAIEATVGTSIMAVREISRMGYILSQIPPVRHRTGGVRFGTRIRPSRLPHAWSSRERHRLNAVTDSFDTRGRPSYNFGNEVG